MKEGSPPYRPTRRQLLRDATLTSLGVVALSACAGTPGQRKGGEFHGAWPYSVPPSGHFNYFVGATSILGGGSIYRDLFISPLGMWRWADAKWQYMLAESSRLVGTDTYEVKLRSNVKWSNGQDFTSKDVATTFWLLRLQSANVWNFVSSVETPDNTTVRFRLSRPSSTVERFIVRENIRPDSQYGQFVKEAQDLVAAGKRSTDPEWAAARKKLEDFRPPEPLSVGPYKIDPSTITESQLTMVRNTGGFAADTASFDKVVVYQGETAAITPLVLNGDVDYATHGFPLATDRQFVSQGLRVVRGPAYSGPALFPHWEKARAFQDKRVRQAVAHAVNKEESATVTYGESAKAPRYMAGFSDNLVPLWISEADQRKLNPYEFSTTKADQLMRDAGYTKGGDGIWAKGSEKMEFEMTVPSDFADWMAAAQHFTESMQKFGIKITLRTYPNAQQLTDVNDGNFTLAFRGWSIGNPHPQFAFIQDLRTHNTTTAKGGMKYPMKQQASTGPVDFDELINQSGEGFDQAKQKEAVTKLALAFNELLPVIPLWERYGNNPVNDKARVTGWPRDNDPIYKSSFGTDNFTIMMIADGTLKPV